MQFKLAAYLSLQALAGVASAVYGYPGNEQPCMDLHIVCARGSDEPAGTGIIGEIGYMVNSRVANSNTIGLKYPATFASYAYSELAGVHNLTAHIHHYTNRCPDAKLALMGYSQGAQVIGDVLYGNTEHGKFNNTQPLEVEKAKHIAAVVLMGDPTFEPGHDWDAGTSTRHGVFHRHDISWAYAYAPVTRSYCDHGDVYCARGHSATAHGEYVDKYKEQAATFIVRSFRRSQEPDGGVDVEKFPSHHGHNAGKDNKGKGHGSHDSHDNHDNHGNHARNHRSDDPHPDKGSGGSHNAAGTFRQSSSAIAWLLIPLALIMSA